MAIAPRALRTWPGGGSVCDGGTVSALGSELPVAARVVGGVASRLAVVGSEPGVCAPAAAGISSTAARTSAAASFTTRGRRRRLAVERPQLVAHEVQRRRERDGERLRGNLRQPEDRHEQLEEREAEQERDDADDDEADGLEAGVTVAGVERPQPVPREVVRHRD